MNELKLFEVRKALVRAFLRERGLDGLLVTRSDNYAMATGGKRNYVYGASDYGASALYIGVDGRAFFVGTNIEETRQMAEELGPLGCGSLSFPWFGGSHADRVRRAFGGHIVSDDGSLGENVNDDLAYLRSLLTPVEMEKYRRLGALAAEAMTATVQAVTPGMAEAGIAARLVCEGVRRRCQVPVALVAADERIAQFRHPLPTEAPLVTGSLAERGVRGYVMVVGCFLREGLVASITRFARVGDVAATVPDAYARVCAVDAVMQEATAPGKSLGDVFAACQGAYTLYGFPANEWHNHHQGGAAGYAGRSCKGAPGERFPVLGGERYSAEVRALTGIDVEFGQAYAWNPSAVGVKSEDTFLIGPDGTREIVTRTPSLPPVDLERVLGRPTEVVKSGMAGA